ncbi:unnamed protein product [Linum trigynum]|uniref:Uncharacterized protein n=1 Tax=Linum trigynum TaxID=586398 RepID=A0AAV2F6V2_9ROSI
MVKSSSIRNYTSFLPSRFYRLNPAAKALVVFLRSTILKTRTLRLFPNSLCFLFGGFCLFSFGFTFGLQFLHLTAQSSNLFAKCFNIFCTGASFTIIEASGLLLGSFHCLPQLTKLPDVVV